MMNSNIEKNNVTEINKILSQVNEASVINAMVEMRHEQKKKYIENIYVISCVLLIFISLILLDKYRFLCSILIVSGIISLHFKFEFLSLLHIPLKININKNKQE